ncbi:MAG: biopolymer transporter ExbD [Verrucomicrobiota bacterium]
MGKRFNTASSSDDESAVDISPLIDVVFILLIFFIVTTVFVEETGVEITKPRAVSAADLEKNSILIAVTPDGDVVYGGKSIGVTGIQSTIKRMSSKEQLPVILQADQAVNMDLFMRAYDQAVLTGAKVSVSTLN